MLVALFLSPTLARIKWSTYLMYWTFLEWKYIRKDLKSCLTTSSSQILFDTLHLRFVCKLPKTRLKRFSRTLSWRFACTKKFLFSSPPIKLMLKYLSKCDSNWMSSSCKKLSVSIKAYYKLCFLWLELHKRFATHAAPYGLLQYYNISNRKKFSQRTLIFSQKSTKKCTRQTPSLFSSQSRQPIITTLPKETYLKLFHSKNISPFAFIRWYPYM